jgi:proteasome assembly chaperone (PAC2) family protein
MENDVWIQRVANPILVEPVAVVGSPGLRSVGKLAVEKLIAQKGAKPLANLYSTHLPAVYQTTPSYAAHPSLPGEGGALVEFGQVDFPKVEFSTCLDPPLVFARGYHANFTGQFAVAEKVVDFLGEFGVKKLIVVAGYGSTEKKVCCAATAQKAIDEMREKFGVGLGYKGPFMGFSGLVFGLAKVKGIEAVCLFAGAEPREDNLEFPDEEAAGRVVELLNRILGLNTGKIKSPNEA